MGLTAIPAINLAAPGAIGGTTPAAITGTTITATTKLVTANGSSTSPTVHGSDTGVGISFEPGGVKGVYFSAGGSNIGALFGNGQFTSHGSLGFFVSGSDRVGPATPVLYRAGTTTSGFYFDSSTFAPGFSVGGVAVLVSSSTALTLGDAINLSFNTTTGTKIGTATTQKISFWNATPVVQPAHIADPTGGATVDAEARTAINAILAWQATLGLTAAS